MASLTVLIMVFSMMTTFCVTAHGASDSAQTVADAYIIYNGWSDAELAGTADLSLYFGGQTHTVNPTTHKLFNSYEDAYAAAYGNADITPQDYFDFCPTFVFGPGDYSGETIHVPTKAKILGANAGISPNATVADADRTIKYFTDNGGWPANSAYDTSKQTNLGAVSFTTRDKGSDGGWSAMPTEGEGAKWHYLRNKAFIENPDAELDCVIDGVNIGGRVALSAYDRDVAFSYNGDAVERSVDGKKTNVYIKNSTTSLSSNLVTAWNTTWNYQNFFFEGCRFDKNISDFGTRYVDDLTFTDCYFGSFSTESALFRTWIGESGLRYDTANLTVDRSVFYNCTAMQFHVNVDTMPTGVNNVNFTLKNSVLYNAGTATWGIFRLTNTSGRNLTVNVQDNLIYHTNAMNTLFNGNKSYVKAGKNTIHFNGNRVVSPTLGSLLPNMGGYNILDTTDSSGNTVYGTNTLFDIDYNDNFFSTSETAEGKFIAFHENSCPVGTASDSMWTWDWNDPIYYYDFACDYSTHGAKVTGVKNGASALNGDDVSLYVNSTGTLTADSLVYRDTDSKMNAVISASSDFSSTVDSIDLSKVKSGDVYYVKACYADAGYASKTEKTTKITLFLQDAELFNDAFLAGEIKVGDKVLTPDNTVVVAATGAAVLSGDNGDCFYGSFAGKQYRFDIDNQNVFANREKTYSYTTVDGAVKTHQALDVDVFKDKCENGNIVIVGGVANARLVPTYPVTFYGANAGIDPVKRDGLTASLSSAWDESGETMLTNSIVMAYDIDGEVVFDGFTFANKYYDDVRYGKEGTLKVTFRNTVVDSVRNTSALFYLNSPRATNGDTAAFADVEFGKINNDSFAVENCYVRALGDNQIINENICPNVTIDNFHIDNVAAGKPRDLIGFLKLGIYNKKACITVKNSSFVNSSGTVHPLFQYQGFRTEPDRLIDDSYDIDIKFNNNIVYNSGSAQTYVFYLASGQMSSLEVVGNTFVSTDKARTLMVDIETCASSESCQLAGNITISDNSFAGFDASTLACDLNMGANNPMITKSFVYSGAVSDPKAFIGQQLTGITYGDMYLNFDRSALLSDYSIKSIEVEGGRATIDNVGATVNIERTGTGDVTFINRNSNAKGTVSGDLSKTGTCTYTISLNGMSRTYTVNVTTADYSDYTVISTAEQFNAIRNNPSGKYLLANDITLSGTFSPIANFTGVLDGGFHSINGLKVNISSSSNVTAGLFKACSGTVKNLSVYGSVTVKTTANAYVGGIAGSGSAKFIDCYSHIDITVNAKSAYVGGIASSASDVVACYNAGNINVTSTDYSLTAGIAAEADTVSKCYNAGAVTASGDACGISCYGYITNCYNAGVITADALASGITFDGDAENCYNAAYVNGGSESYGVTLGGVVINSYYAEFAATGAGKQISKNGLSEEESYVAFDFGTVWQMSDDASYPFPVLTSVPNVATVTGDKNNGSPFDPFLINNIEQFKALEGAKGGYYRLENDLDLGEFTPVSEFSGHLDGNGKEITVNITSDEKYVGLFAKNSGIITGIGVKGNVTSTAKDAYVGGIVGENKGTLTACYNSATINANDGSYVGGIAGKGNVSLCYNVGTVNGGGVTGGLVGHGKAVNCYNVGNVSANGYVGGIAGIGSAEYCYNLGNVTGENVGAVAGRCNAEDVVANSYYLSTLASNGYGKACAPSEFDDMVTYAGFDFVSFWTMSEDIAYPYAVLKDVTNIAQFADESCGFAGGNGSAFDPFLIENAGQLDSIRNYPDAHFKLIEDITLDDAGFTPVGEFAGVLDGNGHAIYNLHVNTDTDGALFIINKGTVKNLGIAGCDISVTANARVMAAVLAVKNYGTVENCYTNGSVTVNSSVPAFASAFVGENHGTVTNCYSAVQVNSNYYATGFAIYNYGDITNCYSVSTLSSAQNTGIFGFAVASTGDITGCVNVNAKNDGGVDFARPASAMSLRLTYSEFDFENVWSMSTSAGYPFPVLNAVKSDLDIMSGENAHEFGGGNGSAVSPFVVKTAEHLANVGKYPDAYFVQTESIDLDGAEYTPVSEFCGVYDGAGQIISNVKIVTEVGMAGLFAVNYGKITGVNLENAYYNVNSEDEIVFVGGIVGENYGGIVTSCAVDAELEVSAACNAYVGGIVGNNYGKAVETCKFDGAVDVRASGTAYVGGIAGYSISDVSGNAAGAVATKGAGENYLGGIVGLADGAVSGENYALVYAVNGGGYIGGVVGKNTVNNADVTNTLAVNHGAVVSQESTEEVYVGGVIGYTTENVNKAFNTGAVTALSEKSVVGGVVGMSAGNVTNVFNSVEVTGVTAGGIIGHNAGNVTASYSLTGDEGDNHGTFTNCLFGTACTTAQSAYTGFDFTNVWTMSGNASYAYPELSAKAVVNNAAQITVSGLKTEYSYSETAKDAVSIEVTYKFGGSETVTSDNYYLIGFDSYQIGEQSAIVAFDGAFTTATLEVLCPHYYDGDCDEECNVCHEKREAVAHKYSATFDDTNHYYECTVCGNTFGETAHVFDNACDTTCSGCKYVRTTAHDNEAGFDDVNHFDKCTICGEITNSKAHVFDNGCDTDCNECEYTRTTSHSYAASYDETNHFYKCKECGDTFGVTAHKFDNGCDTTCSGCKYVRTTAHENEQKYDDTNHYYECTVCGAITGTMAHVFDNACDTDCNECEYTRTIKHSYAASYDETNHFYKCSVCGDTFGVMAHKFDNACDTTCSGCKYVRTTAHENEQKYDDTNHYYECTVCGAITGTGAHVFDNACDTDCNECEYTRTTSHSYAASYDETNHFYKCKECGDTFGEMAHKFDNGCDTTCSGCKYVRTAEHAWGDWVYNNDATTSADGTKTRTCTSCGVTETVTAEGTKLPSEPGVIPDNRLPQVVMNDAGNGVTTDMRGSWATRVYWGYIGTEEIEYKWFDDFRLGCGTEYTADFTPRANKSYYFTKVGYYRFVLKCIISGDNAENYKYKDMVYTFYYDGKSKVAVPSLTMIDGNTVQINKNDLAVTKLYYGNIGQENVPYGWFNDFWGKALGTKTYKVDFGVTYGEQYKLVTKGFYNFVIVYKDTAGATHELVYTVEAKENIGIITASGGKATLTVDNVGGKVNKLYWGYIGESAEGVVNYDTLKAACGGTLTGDWTMKTGRTYTLSKTGYYGFSVNYTMESFINGAFTNVTYDIIYIVENK